MRQSRRPLKRTPEASAEASAAGRAIPLGEQAPGTLFRAHCSATSGAPSPRSPFVVAAAFPFAFSTPPSPRTPLAETAALARTSSRELASARSAGCNLCGGVAGIVGAAGAVVGPCSGSARGGDFSFPSLVDESPATAVVVDGGGGGTASSSGREASRSLTERREEGVRFSTTALPRPSAGTAESVCTGPSRAPPPPPPPPPGDG